MGGGILIRMSIWGMQVEPYRNIHASHLNLECFGTCQTPPPKPWERNGRRVVSLNLLSCEPLNSNHRKTVSFLGGVSTVLCSSIVPLQNWLFPMVCPLPFPNCSHCVCAFLGQDPLLECGSSACLFWSCAGLELVPDWFSIALTLAKSWSSWHLQHTCSGRPG